MNKCYNGGINYLQDTTLYKDCYGYAAQYLECSGSPDRSTESEK